MGLSRRTVLRFGLGGATLLALGGVGLALRPGALRPAPPGLQVFDARHYSVVAAVADRFCPGGAGLPSAGDLGLAALVDQHVATLHPGDIAELLQGILLLENALAGAILDGQPAAFTARTPAAQDATLEAWQTSGLAVRRKVFKALRSLIAAAYWGHPDLYAGANYPGPPDFSPTPPTPAPSHDGAAPPDDGAPPPEAEASP